MIRFGVEALNVNNLKRQDYQFRVALATEGPVEKLMNPTSGHTLSDFLIQPEP